MVIRSIDLSIRRLRTNVRIRVSSGLSANYAGGELNTMDIVTKELAAGPAPATSLLKQKRALSKC